MPTVTTTRSPRTQTDHDFKEAFGFYCSYAIPCLNTDGSPYVLCNSGDRFKIMHCHVWKDQYSRFNHHVEEFVINLDEIDVEEAAAEVDPDDFGCTHGICVVDKEKQFYAGWMYLKPRKAITPRCRSP